MNQFNPKRHKKSTNNENSPSKDYFGYKTDENRFHDNDLATPFIWKKKWEKTHPKLKGKKLQKLVKAKLKERQAKLKTEIYNVKALRTKRLEEKAAMEKMREEIQKRVERENYELLNQKEDQFHKENIKEGAVLRIKSGREKLFDSVFKTALFAANDQYTLAALLDTRQKNEINGGFLEDSLFNESVIEVKNPFEVISKAQTPKIQNLKNAAEKIIELGNDKKFWNQIIKMADYFLCQENNNDESVFNIVSGKSVDELNKLEKDIKSKIAKSGDQKLTIDIGYWQGLIPVVNLFKSKIIIDNFFEIAISRHFQLKKYCSKNDKKDETKNEKKIKTIEKFVEPNFKIFKNEKERKKVSKKAISLNQFLKNLAKKRNFVLSQITPQIVPKKAVNPKILSLAQNLYNIEASKPSEKDEEVFFSKDISSSKTNYWWQDKFRPRKPLYFNRVKTGYDWTKYNASHYDNENPPPKSVMGYKFNIFYPDLIDINSVPSFVLEEIPGNPDYIILKFKAGPPYEDIAFKIINKEWNREARWGYRSTFSNGVMQLFFNFRRYRYRR